MKTKLSIAITAALISSAAVASTSYTAKPYSPEITSVVSYKKADSVINHTAPQRFIVELESPSLSKYSGGISTLSATTPAKQGQKINVQSRAAKSYSSHLAQEQNQFQTALSKVSTNSKIERKFQTLFNGVTIVGQGLSIKQLMAIPGVKSVYPETMYEMSMDASHEAINSQAMWDAVAGMENAGKGIRVAVIDGGIRPENPMFADDGFAAPEGAMPTDDYCSTVDTTFCNNKLIVARWSQPTFQVCPDEYMSPLGFGGHGTHVAGTAVGNKVSATFKEIDVELSGVAPAAYLMAYKALYSKADCSGGSGSNIMLMEALEHAVNDGADVINNSWGGGAGGDPANSPYKTMFEAAEAAGVVVVSAAGNDGNSAKTIGCPACIESGITVANSTTGRFFANSFNAGADDLLAIEANNNTITADISAPIIAAANLDADNFEGCTAFPADSFKDGIALISRGECNFSLKAEHALAAGAKAMVVYNSKAGSPISMHMPDATLSSVMISKADGTAIIESLGEEATTGSISAEVQRIVSKSLADTINAGSSRGPNGNENILKPDIAAPGTNILSAFSPDDGGDDFNMISGTSMASPHVAGAAAMMRQLHPDWSANDIKTALTSTASMDGILDDDAETPASPFAMGAGRMDLDAAAKAILTFDKPSIAADSCVGKCTFTRTVYNKSEGTTSWTLSASTDSAGISVSPSSLELEAGASAELTVTVDSTFSEYGSWVFGNIMISSDDGKQDAHLPLAVKAKESSDSSLLSITSTATDIEASDTFPIKTVVNNSIFENTVTVLATAPQGTSLTSKDDVIVSLNGAQQNGFNVNEDLGLITWVGKLDLPEMTSEKDVGGFPSIIDLGVTPEVCEDGCDETAITFSSLPSFKYNGTSYDSITMSDNGLAVVGGGTTSGTYSNKELPDSANPNNILAPFWADFDLADTSGTDSGGGDMAMGVFTGGDGTTWLALEWKNAQLWNDASNTQYSFSIWIKTGDDELVLFNYLDIPNMPSSLTIGAENIGGSVGTTFHYNGQGESVSAGDAVVIESTAPGGIELEYSVKATEFNPGSSDSATVEEEASVEFNVLDNDSGDQKVARSSVSGDGITAKAQNLIDISPVGKLAKATVVDAPSNGTVSLNEDGMATYTPTKDFFGVDSFTYSSEDEDGNVSSPVTATVTVSNINDAPTVAPSAESRTINRPIEVNSNVKDVDGDDLTFTWVQTSGPEVSFDESAENITFTATEVGTYGFTVVANDGTLSSEVGSVSVEATASLDFKESSGGSLGWLTMLLLPFAGLRRRKR